MKKKNHWNNNYEMKQILIERCDQLYFHFIESNKSNPRLDYTV